MIEGEKGGSGYFRFRRRKMKVISVQATEDENYFGSGDGRSE
jgi:hypothetical protein